MDFRYWGMCVWQSGGDYITFKDVDLSYIGGSDQHNDYTTRFGNGLQMWQGIHDITIERCRIDNVYDAGITPQGTAASYTTYNIYIRNNIISNCEYSIEFWERTGSTTHDVYIENNTLIDAGGGWAHNQRPTGRYSGPLGCHFYIPAFSGTKSDIYIRNNILYNATESIIILTYITDIDNMVLDYNSYYQSVGGGAIGYLYVGTITYSTFAGWKIASSQEAHAINSDPLFMSVLNFHLQSTSLAINAGITTSLTTDYDGYVRNIPPSIGAYDYDSNPTSRQ